MDHPRSRGEYNISSEIEESGQGSSPLSRGILGCGPCSVSFLGIIPALAGNTFASNSTDQVRMDHPRSRGEYGRCPGRCIWRGGSSPLSRGIPTLGAHRQPTTVDHPRSRGEYRCRWNVSSSTTGSSPLSRGIPSHEGFPSSKRGIIPALAGNTRQAPAVMVRHTDHPRSRGEYVRQVLSASVSLGSSPLSRGIHGRQSMCGRPMRIIPALAGNTCGVLPPAGTSEDHPRSRGEYEGDFYC